MRSVKTLSLPSFDEELLFISVCQNSEKPVNKLVMIHGLTGDAEAYSELNSNILDALPNTIIYSIDLRGHGWSSYSFPHNKQDLYQVYAADIEALREYLGLHDMILIGQSMAGMIIQEYVNTYGNNFVRGIVLISSAFTLPKVNGSYAFWYRKLATIINTAKPSPRRRQLTDHTKFKGSWDYSPSRIASDIYFTQVAKYFLLWLAVLGWRNPYIETLNTQRVLLIAGTHDWVIPLPVQRHNHQQIPKAQYVELPTNHNAIVNNPELVAETIVDFIKNLKTQL